MNQDPTKHNDTDEIEIDLVRICINLLRALKKVWPAVLVLTVLGAVVVTFLQQKTFVPSYRAYCSFSVRVINKSTLNDTNSLYAIYYDKDLAEQLDKTFSYLLSSDILTEEIKEYLGEEYVNGNIRANCIKGSNIFVLNTYSNSPENAGKLLNAVMSVHQDVAEYVVGDLEMDVIEEPIISNKPYNTPNRIKGIMIGGALGFVLSMGLLCIYAFLKRTVLNPEDLEKYLNMPCFGIIPLFQMKNHRRSPFFFGTDIHEQSEFSECIRGIARRVEHAMKEKNAKVLLITSTAPGEGKTTLCHSLAETFAYWGQKVIAFDGDLRRPSLWKCFEIKDKVMDMESVLLGKAPKESIICPQENRSLTLVGNTVVVEKSTVIIDSPAMKEMISDLSEEADILIIDSPPCEQIIDASLFQQYADCVLYVVQQDRIPIDEITAAAETLCHDENKLLSYVMNGVQHHVQGYGKYGYGKYGGYYGRYSKYGRYGKYSNKTYGNKPYGSYSNHTYTERSERGNIRR